ncbi:hypothetical protein RZO85_30385, partial [Raoultella ornithinolytica]|nr:hypothetical protein [Raoultella ornithinolytica]
MLLPFGCGERQGHAYKSSRKPSGRVTGKRKGRKAALFSIGSAPLTSITESDAQISGGETRQDYKDTR